jgi:hypothetical protein
MADSLRKAVRDFSAQRLVKGKPAYQVFFGAGTLVRVVGEPSSLSADTLEEQLYVKFAPACGEDEYVIPIDDFEVCTCESAPAPA